RQTYGWVGSKFACSGALLKRQVCPESHSRERTSARRARNLALTQNGRARVRRQKSYWGSPGELGLEGPEAKVGPRPAALMYPASSTRTAFGKSARRGRPCAQE